MLKTPGAKAEIRGAKTAGCLQHLLAACTRPGCSPEGLDAYRGSAAATPSPSRRSEATRGVARYIEATAPTAGWCRCAAWHHEQQRAEQLRS